MPLQPSVVIGTAVKGEIRPLGTPSAAGQAYFTLQEPWTGPRWEVAAGFNLVKGGGAEWLVEKCVELGAYSLLPLFSHRMHSAGGASHARVSL